MLFKERCELENKKDMQCKTCGCRLVFDDLKGWCHHDGMLWHNVPRPHPAVAVPMPKTDEKSEARFDLQRKVANSPEFWEQEDRVANCNHVPIFAHDIGEMQCCKCGITMGGLHGHRD